MGESNQRTRTSIYTSKATLKKFQEICRREGVKVSRKLEDFMFHYVQAHSHGNPQLPITVYAKPEEPQPMRVLCLYCDGAVTDGRIHCKKASMWVPGVRCYSCEKNELRKQK
jgi:hypothetical protein